jgi:hypothetical protein
MPRRRKPTYQRRKDRFPHGRERNILGSTASDDKSNAGTGSNNERLIICLSHSLGVGEEGVNFICYSGYNGYSD